MADAEYFLRKVSTGKEFPIAEVMSVGRSEDSDVRLIEGKPSRHHARITLDQSHVFIEDLDSTNGTFINGRRLDAKVKLELSAGDLVRFDLEEFVFVDAKPSDKTVFRPPPERVDATQKLVAVAPSPPDPGAACAPVPAPLKAHAVENPRPAEAAAARSQSLPGAFTDPEANATILVPKNSTRAATASGSPSHVAGDTPYLWIDSGSSAGKKFELKGDSASDMSWPVGSGENSAIRFEDPGVSAKHATLSQRGRTWWLTDDLAINGTYVNDNRILRSSLANGDRLRFGPVECRFYVPAAKAGDGAAGRALWRKYGLIAALAFVLTLALVFALYLFTK